jgi:D-3-phosphoglycerate dehydrogenase / 2-oxoglutarate reductase
MFKVLVSDKLSEKGMEVFKREKDLQVDEKLNKTPEELKSIVGEYDAWAIRSGTTVTAELIQAATKLRIIGRAGVGVDNVDLEAATKRGIIVMNTPDGNTISTSEHTIAMLMAMARQIPQAQQSLKEKKWERSKFVGCELNGKTLGVIGLGRIGTNVAKKAMGLGMRVIAYDPYVDPTKVKGYEFEVTNLEEVIKRSDFITVHTPLTDATRGFIGQKQIAGMKNGVRLVNCARGGIIDEAALYEGLKNGKIAGVALDVFEKEPPFDSPLLALDNVVCVPHLGASTKEAQVNVAVVVAEQMVEALKGGRVLNAVNMPSLDPKLLEEMKPYLLLTEKIGSFHSQLAESFIKEIKVEYNGEVAQYDTKPLTLSLVKGILQKGMSEPVNYVNALVIAKERGYEISETTNTGVRDFSSLITVTVKNEKGSHVIAGTVLEKKELRIVNLDGNTTDFTPAGNMIWMVHQDRPGIVGRLGTILGSNNVNIAGLHVGRQAVGGTAIAMVNVDNEVPEKVMSELGAIPHIQGLKFVKF